MKYKIGDKVRIIDLLHSHGFKIGEIVVISDTVKNGINPYMATGEFGEFWYVSDKEIELIEPESHPNHSQSLASDLNIDLNAEPDMVNHPPHYANKTPETIQMIRAVLTKEEFIGYCKGQILKYRDRAHDKGNLEQDMAKAKFYYDLLEEVSNERD